jgi:KDO2-lipid IV(A) lauroyltransferase
MRKSTVKKTLELFAYRLGRGLIRLLPESGAYAVMERLAWWFHDRRGWRREETRERMLQVFPERSLEERETMRKEAVLNLGRMFTELLRMPADFEDRCQGTEETLERFAKARERGKGVILVLTHSGNWEQAGVVCGRHGIPMCYIARTQQNSRIYQDLVTTREDVGATVFDRDDPRLIRKVLGHLKERNGVLALLVDIRDRTPGDTFRYLGQEAWLSNGLGFFATMSGAEVIPVFLGRDGRKQHVWKIFPSRHLDRKASKEERDQLLQDCLDLHTAEILKNPGSYFWFNKRWVLEPFE